MENKIESEKDEGFLFEIWDYAYIYTIIYLIPITICILLYGALQIIGIIDNSNPTLLSRPGYLIGLGFCFLFYFLYNLYKAIKVEKYKIKFYEHKILKTSNKNEISLKDIDYTFSILNLFLVGDKLILSQYLTYSSLGKFFRIFLGMIFIFPLFGIFIFIVNLFLFKRLTITRRIFPISLSSKEAIAIFYPLPNQEEQKKVEEYFQVYLNTDIKTLKTRLI